MKCPNCNHANHKRANYCSRCGRSLQIDDQIKNNRKKKLGANFSNRNKHSESTKTIFSIKSLCISSIIIIGIFLMYTIIDTNVQRNNRSNISFPDQKSENPIVEIKVFDIASKFICGCGSCDEEPLDQCKCTFAVNERQFIREYLEDSKKEKDVIAAVIAKYGGLKAEFKN